MVLDLTKGVKFYFINKYVTLFWLLESKDEMLPFKAFKSIENHGKEFYTCEYCLQIRYQL